MTLRRCRSSPGSSAVDVLVSLLLLSCGDVEAHHDPTINRISVSAPRVPRGSAAGTSSESGSRAFKLSAKASCASESHKSAPAADKFGEPGRRTPGRVVGKTSVSELRVGCVNTRFVVNKMALSHNAIDELRLGVLVVTKTWIKADHPAVIKSDPAPPGFIVLYPHRPSDRNGGGVAVVAEEALNACPISLSGSYSSFDFLEIQLTVKTSRLNFASVYRPPQTCSFLEDFRNFLDEVVDLPGGLYICGDVNCQSIATGHIERHLEQVIDDFDMLQHVSVPKHNLGGLLVVVITSPQNPTVIGITVDDLGISVHSIVLRRCRRRLFNRRA